MRYRYAAAIAAIAGLVPVGTRAADDAALGETIAVESCSACHQVKASQAIPPPVPDPDAGVQVPAPSFADIAARGHDADTLRRLILNPPHPMREQQWSEVDLKAVIDYLNSLRAEPRPN